MCGRFFVDAKNREIDRLLDSLPAAAIRPRTGEVFPTNHALVLANDNGRIAPASMQWGFPRREGKGVIINARAESALSRPMFGRALQSRPVAIPSSGFFEWKAHPGEKRKDKFFLHAQEPTLWLAGFWDKFADSEENKFVILTTAANPSVLPVHDRMPLLLENGQIEPWLTGKNLRELLKSQPFPLRVELVPNG